MEQFIQPQYTEVNSTVALVERMQKHVLISLKKLTGAISIRKQSEKEPGRDPTKSNKKEASRIKIPERKLSKQKARRSSKRKLSKEATTNKRVNFTSPGFLICSHNSAPPERISLDGTVTRKSKIFRKASIHFGELASETAVNDEIGVSGASYSASFQPEQVPDFRPMIERSVQLCPQEHSNSETSDDEDDVQEYELDI